MNSHSKKLRKHEPHLLATLPNLLAKLQPIPCFLDRISTSEDESFSPAGKGESDAFVRRVGGVDQAETMAKVRV